MKAEETRGSFDGEVGEKIGPDIFLWIEEGVCNCHLGGCIIRLNYICVRFFCFYRKRN